MEVHCGYFLPAFVLNTIPYGSTSALYSLSGWLKLAVDRFILSKTHPFLGTKSVKAGGIAPKKCDSTSFKSLLGFS